jgi:hypothetical protein
MPVELLEMARATRKLAISGPNGRSAASPVNLAPKSGPRLRGVDCGRSAQERHVKEARVVSKKWAFLKKELLTLPALRRLRGIRLRLAETRFDKTSLV